jgi:2,4-dienoyl-CoA reductase-like NADH-dependent reductase (Old Yellow Enzyme family)
MSEAKDSVLFEPLRLGHLQVSGRVFKSATTETLATEDGYVTDGLLGFYEPIAYAGTPLIVTGSLYVNLQGKAFRHSCGIDTDDKVSGLRQLTDVVHRYGSRIFAQLGHGGRQMFPEEMGLESAVSASAVHERAFGTKPRAMTVEEIRETIADYGAAAERAQASGFDGIEILAGVGYLLSAFLTPHTNRRKDEYGGSSSNRMRFLLEVLRVVRARVGPEFPVIAKLNGTDALPLRAGLKTADLVEIASVLEAEGLDGIEITAGHYESGMVAGQGRFNDFFHVMVNEGRLTRGLSSWRRRAMLLTSPLLVRAGNRIWPAREGFLLPYARQFKARLDIPVVCIGGFLTADGMEKAITTGQCDAVSVGRAMIADPLLYKHLRNGGGGPVCNFCTGCAARVGYSPVDCYNSQLRAERAAMLADEGLPRSGEAPDELDGVIPRPV